MKKMTMASLIDWLSRFTDRPVVDQTELKGRYDLELDLSRDEMLNAARDAGCRWTGRRRVARRGVGPRRRLGVQVGGEVRSELDPRRLPLTLLVVDRMNTHGELAADERRCCGC